ncbi:MAG: alpha/beta hydrolase [Dehalococcoidia bacterium]|nr:alpha/beta hydrolase [Dehalococcoidia bacterium]
MTAGSQILETGQGILEYTVSGSGTPVLLIHGAGGGYDQGLWSGKVFLSDSYQTIAVSRFGYLRTPIQENASIKGQAALYTALLDHLNIKKVTVIGISAGGPSAMQFVNDYPERTSKLILLSAVSMGRAPGDQNTFITGVIHTIQQSDYAYWLMASYMQSTFLEFLGVPNDVYKSFSPKQKLLAQEMLDIMHPISLRYRGTINDGKMVDRYGISTESIVTPTLILHARDDALVSYSHAENSHRQIAQSKLIIFDTGGHAMLSQMDRVKDNIRLFMVDTLGPN